MDGLSAKVFRTYNASSTLCNELANIPPEVCNASIEAKLAFYNQANKKVAILCNHQRTVSVKQQEQVEKLKEKVS
jgi:DNA topoisomerase-1